MPESRVTVFPSQKRGHIPLIDHKQENIRVENEVPIGSINSYNFGKQRSLSTLHC